MRKQQNAGVFRITGARQGLEEDVRGRQRRYVISMLVRTVAVLLTVFLWNVERPLAIATLVLGLVMPYVAVVMANAGRESPPSQPASYIPTPNRPSLDAGSGQRTGTQSGTQNGTRSGPQRGPQSGQGGQGMPQTGPRPGDWTNTESEHRAEARDGWPEEPSTDRS